MRNIYSFGLTSFFNDTASEMAYWVLPAFLASLGAGPAQLGLIEGIAESVASFAKLFSGYLTDHIDRRKPPGELAHFQDLGYSPLIGLVASHPLHHTRRDLPDVTDGAMLEPVARGLQAMLRQA